MKKRLLLIIMVMATYSTLNADVLYDDSHDGMTAVDKKQYYSNLNDCNIKYHDACFNLGVIYKGGHGVKKDLIKSTKLFVRSCELGSEDGCYSAGAAYHSGRGTEKSITDAIKYFDKGCSLGNADACHSAGALSKETSLSEAVKYFKKGCDINSPKNCFALGSMYQQKGTPIFNTKTAEAYMKKSCDDKYGKGCYVLGLMHESGTYVDEVDKELGAAYLTKSCLLGYKEACPKEEIDNSKEASDILSKGMKALEEDCNSNDVKTASTGCMLISSTYRYGRGEQYKVDIVLAEKYFNKALASNLKGCEAGNKYGCRGAAIAYKRGFIGKGKDKKLAKEYHKQWVKILLSEYKSGSTSDLIDVAYLYERGKEVERDYDKANKIFTDLCANNDPMGCRALSRSYKKGLGVPKDIKKSSALSSKAREIHEELCEEKDGESCKDIGQNYTYGMGGYKKDKNIALDYQILGCRYENASACLNAHKLLSK